jgi:hypothetical protein
MSSKTTTSQTTTAKSVIVTTRSMRLFLNTLKIFQEHTHEVLCNPPPGTVCPPS